MRKIKHYQYNSLDFHKKVVNSKRNTKEDVDKKKRLTALLPTSQKAFADYDAKFSRNVLQTLTPIRLTKQEEADYIGLYDFHSSVFTQLFDSLTTNDGSNCNSKKSNKWFADDNWDYINLYLDELPNKQFLFVDLAIDNKTLKVKFYIDNRNHIDENLFLKISNHYTKLDLCRRFEQYSNQEISEVATLIKSFSKCVTDEKCKEVILNSCRELQRQFGFNYWKAILRFECCNNKSVYQFFKTK